MKTITIIYRWLSVMIAVAAVVLVEIFLSPYRSELGVPGIKDENGILVAIFFLTISIFVLMLNFLFYKFSHIAIRKGFLVTLIALMSINVVSLIRWMSFLN